MGEVPLPALPALPREVVQRILEFIAAHRFIEDVTEHGFFCRLCEQGAEDLGYFLRQIRPLIALLRAFEE